MIRWYDYLAAFFIAEFITRIIFTSIIVTDNVWWMYIVGILAIYGWYNVFWNEWYTGFRLRQEKRKGN